MMAAADQVDAVLIENKSRGQDLYQELELLMREWPYQLIYTTPTVSKEIRLESCVPLFVNERVWAPDKAWAELVINEVEEQNYSHKAQHNDLSDTCLAAGTMIATARGPKPIETIIAGDLVVTPLGFKPVLWSGQTGIAPVIERFGVCGTPNHPAFTFDSGWVRLDTIAHAQRLSRLSLCGLIRTIHRCGWSSSALPTIGVVAENTTCAEAGFEGSVRSSERDFTSRYGSMRAAARFRRCMTSITRIVTLSTTILTTWSRYRAVSIASALRTAIRKLCGDCSPMQHSRRGIGIKATKAAHGIARMLRLRCLLLMRLGWLSLPETLGVPAFADGAGRSLSAGRITDCFAVADARIDQPVRGGVVSCLDRAISTSAHGADRYFHLSRDNAPLDCIALRNVKYRETGMFVTKGNTNIFSTPMPIYNLSVEDAECYYANGILVHNCAQALRHFRDSGMLSLGEEFARETRRAMTFKGKTGRFDAGAAYEGE